MKLTISNRRSLFATFVVCVALHGAPTLARPRCHDDDDSIAAPDVGGPADPITTAVTQMRRLCAALCASGLGGAPCGPGCIQNVPKHLPRRQSNASDFATNTNVDRHVRSSARRDVCPLLCDNELGYPLCSCSRKYDVVTTERPPLDCNGVATNWDNVCVLFCLKYYDRLPGCFPCKYYKERAVTEYNNDAYKMATDDERVESAQKNARSLSLSDLLHGKYKRNQTNSDGDDEMDWDEWCKQKCKTGDGGAACNCDLLPYSAAI